MSKISINLTPKYRLDFKLVRRKRVEIAEPLIPTLRKLRSVRRGSKTSRFFRHIFEHKRIKRILGTNLALITLAGSLLPQNSAFLSTDPEDTVIAVNEVNFNTQRGINNPVDKINISQGYSFFHPGIDFDGLTGDPVRAIMGGIVAEIQYSNYGYGNAILLGHGGGISSMYAHLSKINVDEGQKVEAGEVIGEMGSSGRSSGDHLHLEIRDNGRAVSPLVVLPN